MSSMKKQHYFIIELLLLFVGFTSCSNDEEYNEGQTTKVIESNVSFDANGGTGFIRLESSVSFTVTCKDSWCKAVDKGNNLIEVTVASSQESESRTALVVISTADKEYINVPVTQEGCFFTVDKSVIGFNNQAGTKSVRVNSNKSIRANAEGDWLSATVNGETLMITVKENPGNSLRSSRVILECENHKDTVLVNQGEIDDLLGKYQFTGTDIAKMGADDSIAIEIDWIAMALGSKVYKFSPFTVDFRKQSDNSYSLIVQYPFYMLDQLGMPTDFYYFEFDIPIVVNEEDLSFTIISGNYIGIFDSPSDNSKYSMFTATGVFQKSISYLSNSSLTFQYQNLDGKIQAIYKSNGDINGENLDTLFLLAAQGANKSLITSMSEARTAGLWGYVHEPRFVKME